MSVRFWVGARLLDLDRSQCDRGASILKNQLAIMAQFLGAVSGVREIVSCRVVSVGVIKTFGKVPCSNIGVRYPNDIKAFNLEKLLRKLSYSVMGSSDMFALLKSLLLCLL